MKNGLIIDDYGSKFWYKNGELHREYGPAIIFSNGSKEWYKNGELHREDGPAIEYSSGYKVWYLNGKKLSNYRIIRWFEKRNINCWKKF